ncbi:flagellar basal body rod protein FlgF [Vibrio sp.]|nr:flagellar basal body rod protein FlgF [Vibrio sp.]
MNPVLYSAAGGANRILYAQHVSANNLSHSNTTGFKAIIERSMAVEREGAGFNTSASSVSNSTAIDFTAGELYRTGHPLDIGIDGEGFIAVQNPDGKEVYTRAGNIKSDADGRLSINGRSLVNANGDEMILPPYQNVNIGVDGSVTVIPIDGVGSINIGQIKLVMPDKSELAFSPNGYFESKNGEAFDPAANVIVVAENLEQSNVSTMTEMIRLMQSTRQYEMQVKLMKAADQLAANGAKLLRNS